MNKLVSAAIIAGLFFSGCSVEAEREQLKQSQQKKQSKNQGEKQNKKPKKKSVKSKKKSSAIALVMIKKLKVAPEQRAGYDRDLFNHWTSQTGGCDTRDVVLARQDQKGGSCGSDKGLWVSAYDGVRLTDPGDLDVDHMVPLAEAWDSGARSWPSARREAYANDLHPFSLIAVSAGSNREKSDQDPSEWLPDSRFVCQYTARWIAVKFRWRLTVDPAEKKTLTNLVGRCPGSALKLSKSLKLAPQSN